MANSQSEVASKQPASLPRWHNHMYQVWMGDLTPDMGAEFITATFEHLGVKLGGVKRVLKRDYAFLKVDDPGLVPWVLSFHGKPIPSHPKKRFALNHAMPTIPRNKKSIFVCDISRSVSDQELYDFFKERYPSVTEAFETEYPSDISSLFSSPHFDDIIMIDDTVCRDQWGYQKTYGFVSFSNEEERRRSISEMDRAVGLGFRPLTVRIPRHEQLQCQQSEATPINSVSSSEPTPTTASDQSLQEVQNDESDSDDEEVDPNPPLDIEGLNLEIFREAEEHFLSLERCRWQPILSLTSKINSKRVKITLDRTHITHPVT